MEAFRCALAVSVLKQPSVTTSSGVRREKRDTRAPDGERSNGAIVLWEEKDTVDRRSARRRSIAGPLVLAPQRAAIPVAHPVARTARQAEILRFIDAPQLTCTQRLCAKTSA